jgi:hypothetical protein
MTTRKQAEAATSLHAAQVARRLAVELALSKRSAPGTAPAAPPPRLSRRCVRGAARLRAEHVELGGRAVVVLRDDVGVVSVEPEPPGADAGR